MRHRKAGRKLNRSWEHRKAMFRNMARSLVVHESIRTTEARAKEMRKVADKLVTLAVKGDLHAKRQAYKVLGDHGLVKRLFDEIGPRFAGISGGYTRVVKLGQPRPGDAARMAVIEFSLRAGETAEKEEKGKKAKKTAKKAAPKKQAETAEKTEAKAADQPAKADDKAEEKPQKTAKKAADKADDKAEAKPKKAAKKTEAKSEEKAEEKPKKAAEKTAKKADEPEQEAKAEEAPAEEESPEDGKEKE